MNKEALPNEPQNNPGEMPGYDNPNKPRCLNCNSKTWVIATGKKDNWYWNCTNCTNEIKGVEFQ